MGDSQLSIRLLDQVPVTFEPKLCIGKGKSIASDKIFTKLAMFETEMNLSPLSAEEATKSSPLFYVISRCFESIPKADREKKLILRIRQDVLREETGKLEYVRYPWHCIIYLNRTLAEKINGAVPDGFSIKLSISDLTLTPSDPSTSVDQILMSKIVTVDEEIKKFGYPNDSCGYPHPDGCNTRMGIGVHVYFGDLWTLLRRGTNTDYIYKGKLSIHLKIKSADQLDNFFGDNRGIDVASHLLSRAKMMYETKLHSDLSIECGPSGQAKVPAHKAIVAMASPIFGNMLLDDSSKWKRDHAPNVLRLEEMTEDAVNALLAFIYFWGIERAMECPRVAVQLLIVSNKYLIEGLQERMTNLLLVKPDHWFLHIDSLFHLYIFANVSKICDTLEAKAGKILKRRSSELLTSEAFNEALQNDPNIWQQLTHIIPKDTDNTI